MSTTRSDRIIDYLIVGGGLAGATAAEELRKNDQQASIVLVSNENTNPYHRPPLSKEYLRGEIKAEGIYGEGGVYVQQPQWYQEQRIELIEQVEASDLDTRARTVRLSNGQHLTFKNLLLAGGGHPRALDVPGAKSEGIYLLRRLDDANKLRPELVSGKRIVVVGAGFIGLEVAASALTKGVKVTIVNQKERLWPDKVAPEVSQFLQRTFEQHGATILQAQQAIEFVASDSGHVRAVRVAAVDNKEQTQEYPCDLAVVAIGIQLNTELAKSAGLDIDPQQGILVDEHLETKVEGIFAAGDVATYPDPIVGRMHFEHWDNAIATGQAAATNMLGNDEPFRHVPYFFSDQFDLSFNMLGYPSGEDQSVIRGDLNGGKFTAFYVKDGTLQAALMINDDAQMDLIRDLIAGETAVPDPAKLADSKFDLNTLKQSN